MPGLPIYTGVWCRAPRRLKTPLSRPRIAPDTKRFFALCCARHIGRWYRPDKSAHRHINRDRTGRRRGVALLCRPSLPIADGGCWRGTRRALLPDLTRRIARADLAGAQSSQDLAVTLAMLLTLPAAFGLYVLAEPTVNVLFERGAFAPSDTTAARGRIALFLLWPAGLCFGARPAAVIFCTTRHAAR